MYDTNNNPDLKKNEVKENVSNFVDNAKQSAVDVADDAKAAAAQLGNKVNEKTLETKAEALNLIASLKLLLSQYTDMGRANEIKNRIVDKATEIGGVVQDEVSNAYQVSKDRTVQTVQEKPITSLAIALGAGILLGYILGSKQSSNS
ncbi:MAG: hypothetical protein H0W85_06930 [Methylotenera sp.]|nr:hypothetical protein [Methylotenera sp.]